MLSRCEAIAVVDIPGRSVGFHPAAFREILSVYRVPGKQRYNHTVLLWPVPIDKVCLVCVTPLLTNLSSVPETEKAKAGQKRALNAVENKSLSWVSKGNTKLLGEGNKW